MRAASSRSLLARVFVLTILVGAAGLAVQAHSGARRRPGHARRVRGRESDADQPRVRVAHRRRCQSQRERRRLVPEAGRDRLAHRRLPLVRLQGEQVFQRNVFNLVTPNMFAGSILDLEPGTAYEARFVHDRSRRRQRRRGERDQDRDRADAPRADAGRGRQDLSRLPDEVAGAEDRAGLRRDHVRLQLLLRRRRHRAGRPAARQAGRHHPRPRRHLRLSLRVLREPRPRSTRRRRSRARIT